MEKGERLNSLSHLIGAVAALAGLVLLVVTASLAGDPWRIVSVAIYGATLLALYLSSTLYHGLRGEIRNVLRKLDYSAIYLLIAGTYTPFMLVTLRGPAGWTVFGIVWALAAIGITLDLCHRTERRVLPLVIYLVMGWLCVFLIRSVVAALPTTGFLMLLAGGLFYTLGVGFYLLDHRLRHAHAIWHVFVLAGSISHYYVVLFHVARSG